MTMRLPNSVMVHTPRTGGLWFKAVADRLGIKNQVLKGDVDSHFAPTELPPEWRGLPCFCFVRDPLVWLKSRWTHSIEINARADARYFGVHGLFDQCVTPSFRTTVETLLERFPKGICSMTYALMATGCNYVMKAETGRLQDNTVFVLSNLEGVHSANVRNVANATARFNSSSMLGKYQNELNLPADLENRYVEQERLAYKIWESAL